MVLIELYYYIYFIWIPGRVSMLRTIWIRIIDGTDRMNKALISPTTSLIRNPSRLPIREIP